MRGRDWYPIPIEGNFYLVAEIIDAQVDLPYETLEGCYIEYAPVEANDYFERLTNSFGLFSSFPLRVGIDPDDRSKKYVPPAEKRYVIVRCKTQMVPQVLVQTGAILDNTLYLGPSFHRTTGQSVGGTPGLQAHFSHHNRRTKVLTKPSIER